MSIILDIINVICQIIVAILENKRDKINFKTKFRVSESIRFVQEATNLEEFVHEPCITISIFNSGPSKVFVNSIVSA